MPINFESPGAFDSGVAASYGAMQQQLQNYHLPRSEANVIPSQGEMHGGGGGGGNNGELTPRDQGQMMHDFDKSSQDFHQRMALQDDKLSMAEEIRLNAVRNGVSQVQQAKDMGQIGDEDAQDLIFRLNGIASPLQQRKVRQQIQQENLQNQILANASAQQIARQNQNAEFLASNPNGLIHSVDLPNGAGQVHFLTQGYDAQGMPYRQQIQLPREAPGAGQGAAALEPTHLINIMKHVDDTMQEEIKNANADEAKLPAWARTPEARTAERQRRYRESIQMANNGARAPSEGGGTLPIEERFPAFNPTNWAQNTALNPAVQKDMKDMEDLRAETNRLVPITGQGASPSNVAQNRLIQAKINELIHRYAAAGSYSRLKGKDLKEFDDLRLEIRRLIARAPLHSQEYETSQNRNWAASQPNPDAGLLGDNPFQ